MTKERQVFALILLASGLSVSIFVWQLFGSKSTQAGTTQESEDVVASSEEPPTEPPKNLFWIESFWREHDGEAHKTLRRWIFTVPRLQYDPEYRHVLLQRRARWKTTGSRRNLSDKAKELDGIREKRTSSLITYFCIFILILSLIRAAADMTSNLKKVTLPLLRLSAINLPLSTSFRSSKSLRINESSYRVPTKKAPAKPIVRREELLLRPLSPPLLLLRLLNPPTYHYINSEYAASFPSVPSRQQVRTNAALENTRLTSVHPSLFVCLHSLSVHDLSVYKTLSALISRSLCSLSVSDFTCLISTPSVTVPRRARQPND